MYEVTRTIQENKGFGNKEYQNSSSRNNQLHKPGKITLPQWESEPITTTRITYNTWAQADVAHTGSLWAENHSTTQWACGPPNLSADLSTHHKPPVPLPKGCAWLWWNLNKETTGCVYLMRRGTGPLLLDHPTSTWWRGKHPQEKELSLFCLPNHSRGLALCNTVWSAGWHGAQWRPECGDWDQKGPPHRLVFGHSAPSW